MTTPTEDSIPLALRSTFAARRASQADWNARYPRDPEHGLVLIADEDQAIEDHRTKGFLGMRRVRSYARKGDLGTVVAVRRGEGMIEWINPGGLPPNAPVVQGFLRRWRGGNRPPKGSR